MCPVEKKTIPTNVGHPMGLTAKGYLLEDKHMGAKPKKTVYCSYLSEKIMTDKLHDLCIKHKIVTTEQTNTTLPSPAPIQLGNTQKNNTKLWEQKHSFRMFSLILGTLGQVTPNTITIMVTLEWLCHSRHGHRTEMLQQ